MNGTRVVHHLAMFLTPPITTKPTSVERINPTMIFVWSGSKKLLHCMERFSLMALACTVFPIPNAATAANAQKRSEEHTSELQSPDHLVCRLLLEKKKV